MNSPQIDLDIYTISKEYIPKFKYYPILINKIDRKYKKRLTIKIGQHIKIIHIDEIECFYSEPCILQ